MGNKTPRVATDCRKQLAYHRYKVLKKISIRQHLNTFSTIWELHNLVAVRLTALKRTRIKNKNIHKSRRKMQSLKHKVGPR